MPGWPGWLAWLAGLAGWLGWLGWLGWMRGVRKFSHARRSEEVGGFLKKKMKDAFKKHFFVFIYRLPPLPPTSSIR